MQSMEPMLQRSWKTIENVKIPDILEVIKGCINDSPREIHIGTDSQQVSKVTEYVTVITLLEKGKGGRAFYCREQVPRIKSLRERLMKEAFMSVNLGLELNAHIPETIGLTIHVDANPNMKFKSSTHVKELTAMVVSQGFKTLLKPDSWAASHLADHVVKNKVIGR